MSSLDRIPPARLREMAAEHVAKVAKLTAAQALCPEPFRMPTEELAGAIAHHAAMALEYSRLAAESEARPRDGELVYGGLRWCSSCNRTHGALYLCAAYSPEIVAAVHAHEPALAEGAAGSGVAQVVAPFVRPRGARLPRKRRTT